MKRLTPGEELDRQVSEDALLDNIVALAHLTGWLAYHVRNSRTGVTQGDVGFPDMVLVRPPSILFVELKKELGSLEKQQECWREALLSSGAEWYCWRPSDWRTGIIERRLLQ